MSTEGIFGIVLGALGGVGAVVLLGWLRGRKAGGGSSGGSVERAEQDHAAVDEDLANKTEAIEGDRAADHAAADERWKP